MRQLSSLAFVACLIAVLASPILSESRAALLNPRPGYDQSEADKWVDAGGQAEKNRNYAEAVKFYRKAAEQGDARGQLALGVMFGFGRGVQQDYAEAARLYRKAGEQGLAEAQFNLGEMYYSGVGVAQDHAEAARWYRKAAEQGHAKGQLQLAEMYFDGSGVQRSYSESAKLYSMAAEQGSAIGQSSLAYMYHEGQGVSQDYARAVMWGRKAAEQGLADAQYNLGLAYLHGQGVPQNNPEAVKWFRKAADQGHAQASSKLDTLRAEGQGVVPLRTPDERGDGPEGQTRPKESPLDPMSLSTNLPLQSPLQDPATQYREPPVGQGDVPERMGFWEGVWGSQKQGLIPKTWGYLTRETPAPEPGWENPALNDDNIPWAFKVNFAGAQSLAEYDQIMARMNGELDWHSKIANASGLGKFGATLSGVLDPVYILCAAMFFLTFKRSIETSRQKLAKRFIGMRTALGWIVGVAATCLIIFVLNTGIHALGIPTYIDFGDTVTVTHGSGRQSYDTEESGAYTVPGEAILFAGLILGILIGRLVAVWPKSPLFELDTRATGGGVLLFLLVYGIGGALLLMLFRGAIHGFAGVLFNVLQLSLTVSAFLLGRKHYRRVMASSSVRAAVDD